MSEEKKEKKEFFKFFKNWDFLKKLKQVKHIGLIITIIFVLILILILFGDFDFFKTSTTSISQKNATYTSSMQYATEIEDKLKNIIAKIKGSGNVEVMVTLDSSASVILATNDETKSNGGTTTVSANPIILEQNGESFPIVVGEVLPKIKGVVVVSSGASNISVRLNILNAVQTLLNLSDSQINILVGE